ncbi:Indian hedgehog B protein [Porphyridium purpureum]|uniref:Indian hedgehog B protein n=1 Tax=Porphyridium purpureum TaxID=35688 RepID=A0A5J4Z2D6_PORPP|nr:Indian hedgehog B protein [Porphyridium purpureum]|eukprot:POR2709..scf295_1
MGMFVVLVGAIVAVTLGYSVSECAALKVDEVSSDADAVPLGNDGVVVRQEGLTTPTPTPTPTPFTDCFPATAYVELEDGRRVQMVGLRRGDRVRVNVGEEPALYSPVTFWGHRDKNAVGRNYVRIALASGKLLTLSATHLAYVYRYNDSGQRVRALVRANDIQMGDWMKDVDGYSRVAQINRDVAAKGLFNPHTAHGDIVVDGVLVSTYNAVLVARAAHALLMVERLVYQLLGDRISILGDLLYFQTPNVLRDLAIRRLSQIDVCQFSLLGSDSKAEHRKVKGYIATQETILCAVHFATHGCTTHRRAIPVNLDSARIESGRPARFELLGRLCFINQCQNGAAPAHLGCKPPSKCQCSQNAI